MLKFYKKKLARKFCSNIKKIIFQNKPELNVQSCSDKFGTILFFEDNVS
jgi:hypothetical protein